MENFFQDKFFQIIFFLLEEVGNFRGFCVVDFGSYTEIKNSENL